MGATWRPEISGMAKSLKRPDADLPPYMRLSAQRTSKTQVSCGWRAPGHVNHQTKPSCRLGQSKQSMRGPDADLPPYIDLITVWTSKTHMIHSLFGRVELSRQQYHLHSFSKEAADIPSIFCGSHSQCVPAGAAGGHQAGAGGGG